MEIVRQREGAVQVTGELHIGDAEQLRSALARELMAATALVVDLSGVDSCDAASMQLFCSLRKSAERDGKQLQILEPSTAMCETSAIIGLSLEDLTHIPKS
jgi:phospholipid transport system transporter-binding protein